MTLLALEVMTATNFSIDPCNQNTWLNFVCTRRVSGPDNSNQVEHLMEVVDHQTKQILEDDSGNLDDEFLLKEAQTLYYQCKNKALHDSDDVKSIIEYMSQNYGNWPIFTNRDPGENFEWTRMVADLNRISRPGYTPFLFHVTPSGGLAIKLNIGQTTFAISGPDYHTMLRRVQKYSGSKKPYRSEQLDGMTSFFSSLSYATMEYSYPESMTIEELQEKSDDHFKKMRMGSQANIDWLEFFQLIFEGSDIEITPNTVISVPLKSVMSILGSLHYANIRAVANTLNFQLASQLLMETTGLLDDLNTFKCSELNMPRDLLCLQTVKEIFGYSLGTTYLNIHYNDAVNTPAIESLMSKIQLGYIDVIEDTKWMENSTKSFLKDKIKDMKTFITKPDWLTKPGGLEDFYSKLQAANDINSSHPLNFLAIINWVVMKQFSHQQKLAVMDAKKDYRDFHIYDLSWSQYLGTVQATYHKIVNEARVEAGMIQKPIFGASRPGFMNFGGLGMVLAHEIGHSFDTQGRNYDKDGKYGEFWDAVSVKKYNEWVQKIALDYGSTAYQTSETSAETIDPRKTLNEDISDILAVYISYHSYQQYLKELEKKGKKEKLLPGLKKYTPEKLFFMKYANMWCDNKDIQSRYMAMLGKHSTGNTRATLPLKRSKQFAETFSCKIPKQY
ncbi:unnamed protein product [Orchesella dallaii]|uniref:Endothelin-converting enzyme 1 n=1 Tax=Orchesella dallaii TaxID=48710 RepID=A0ABP1QRH0_9HEXA